MIFLCYGIILIGLFFIITSLFGLIRIDDTYQMMHVTTINDMLGVPLLLFGLGGACFLQNQNILGIKIIFLILVTYCVTVINSYILIKILFFVKNQKVNNTTH